MANRLDGVKAVITGGAGAIGMATARAFLREGASVYIADLRAEVVTEAVASLGAGAAGGPVDVTATVSVARMLEDAAGAMGGITALVNNAGTVARAPLEEMPEDDIDRQIAVNFKGVVVCARTAIPYLRGQPNASITSTSSQAGKRGWSGIAVYGATKAAVLGLGRALAVELAPEIRVNSICPGHIGEVGMAWRSFGERKPESEDVSAFAERFAREEIPMQRLQRAEDIANGFVYLASNEASEITGAALNIGGGVVMD